MLMAETPYKFIDRRGKDSGFRHFGYAANGQFTHAVRQSAKREQPKPYDKDAASLVPSYDRRQLMRIGRSLWQNCSVVQSALRQMSQISTATITPQFDGEDKEWGTMAEAWLHENDRWIDIRGWPYCMSVIDRLIVLAIIRDGDIGQLLTEDEQGNPKVQLIPAHRIGSRSGSSDLIKGGPFAGATIIDGVILGDSWNALGYRVLGDTEAQDRDFSVNDMRLHFKPYWPDQIRGYSELGAASIDIQDDQDARRFELIAQKVMASRALIEKNETGLPSQGARIVSGYEGVEAADSPDGVAMHPVYGEELNGGETTYFRAGSNSTLDVLVGDRPTSNQQAFSAETVRRALNGIGWSVDYALDPTKAGGANMRVVVENINDTVDQIRREIVVPIRKWIDGYRISKGTKNGRLPFNAEWWRWEYQFAQRKTADRKYDSEVDIEEMRAGISTLRDVCARRGNWPEDVVKQKEIEATMQLEAAERLSKRFGIPIESALDRLGMLTPNGSQQQKPKAEKQSTRENP